ncbi:MAG: CvpA family protein [Chitinispirillaceae bacterium]|nr:CvpA family protein [Chitinispirillaceae bacterium]
MHALDIIIAVITAFLIFTGLRRGLIGEIIRLSAMIVGIFVAFLYHQDAAMRSPLRHVPLQPEIRNALAFIIIYCLCAVAIIMAGLLIKKIVHLTPLGWIDRLVGGLIGFLKGLLIAYVACLSISSFPVRRIRNDFNHSLVYRGFTALPKGFALKSLLHSRARLRTIFDKNPPPQIDTMRNTFTKFKAAVDSAKNARMPDK